MCVLRPFCNYPRLTLFLHSKMKKLKQREEHIGPGIWLQSLPCGHLVDPYAVYGACGNAPCLAFPCPWPWEFKVHKAQEQLGRDLGDM